MSDTVLLSTVTVSVSVDDSGNITCSPDPVVVTQPDTLLEFDLASPGYEFPDSKAILVLDTSSGNFPLPSQTVGPYQATLMDTCISAGLFHYRVTVVQSSTGTVFSVDPGIRNGSTSVCP